MTELNESDIIGFFNNGDDISFHQLKCIYNGSVEHFFKDLKDIALLYDEDMEEPFCVELLETRRDWNSLIKYALKNIEYINIHDDIFSQIKHLKCDISNKGGEGSRLHFNFKSIDDQIAKIQEKIERLKLETMSSKSKKKVSFNCRGDWECNQDIGERCNMDKNVCESYRFAPDVERINRPKRSAYKLDPITWKSDERELFRELRRLKKLPLTGDITHLHE